MSVMLLSLGVLVVACGLFAGVFLKHIAPGEVKAGRFILYRISYTFLGLLVLYSAYMMWYDPVHWPVLVCCLLGLITVRFPVYGYGILAFGYGLSGFDTMVGSLIFLLGFPLGSLKKSVWLPALVFFAVALGVLFIL